MRIPITLVLATLTTAAGLTPDEVCAGKRRTAGLNQLAVLDPGVNETGIPEIRLEAGQVVVPEKIHVHRYYYTEDIEYQGPFGHGGPTIVVANHPRTGQKLYIETNLPAGAPVISYSEHDITYTYPHRKVQIRFSRWHKDRAYVKYSNGPGLPNPDSQGEKPRLHFAIHQNMKEAGKTALGGIGAVKNAAATGIEKVGELTDNLPGVKSLKSVFDQRSERKIETLRQEGIRRASDAQRFIRTNR